MTDPKEFAKSFALKTHVQVVHEKIKPHICSICGNSFALPSKLKQHIQSVHEGIKPKPRKPKPRPPKSEKLKLPPNIHYKYIPEWKK